MAFYLHFTAFMCLLNEEIVSKLLTDLGRFRDGQQ